MLEHDKAIGHERQIVPGDLVAENRCLLERAKSLLGDHLMVLMGVVRRRQQHQVGLHVPR